MQQIASVNQLLDLAAEELDIPAEIDAALVEEYGRLSTWLERDHAVRHRSSSEIYPQGSRRLRTMVRPVKPGDDYDVDFVYRRDIQRESTTQEELKLRLGEQLGSYRESVLLSGGNVPTLEEGSRCWTLRFAQGFHMDVLPALPHDGSHPSADSRILITDRDLREWQTSDPQGYAVWFEARMAKSIAARRDAMAKAANMRVHEIPPDRVKTPLQRLVQLLKRHRDIQFEGGEEHKPASIIITTLAARTYPDGADLAEALRSFRSRARDVIEVRNGVDWVPNPTNPDENFADRWQKHPERRSNFFEWLARVETGFGELERGQGLHNTVDTLRKALGADVGVRVAKRLGDGVRELREAGGLGVASASVTLHGSAPIPVRPHTFYGRRG